ncbi:hypothetical protein NLI96_g6964 [Meripilus lineatus]|uniref:Uncharacterized protein n=1 Tax=Meripilus lineatus TaxID=2056292 RepID=A0AAD5YDD5_9APHY|nr:hypothetical protein NLI96_g6964 [Physisporinus lineatus]
MDGQTTLLMHPRVERVGWARLIELEVRDKLRQMERGTTWLPIVHISTQPNPSTSHSRMRLPPPNPTPRLPPEILELILQSIRPGIDTIYENIPFNSIEEVIDREEDSIGTLATCCHVCVVWVALCQKLLFSWVILRKSAHLNSLLDLRRASRISHISPHIRRISVAYDDPDDKLGEALPRIATMAPPNLLRIDVLGTDNGFPFHDSLPLRLAPLHYVRILHLHSLKFTNFAEFRRLISCFSGLQVLHSNLQWDLAVPKALHRTANPLLTRISARPYENGLWLWLSPHGSGAGRQSRCSTAQISHLLVPSISAAIVTFMDRTIERMRETLFDPDDHTLDVQWKCKKSARVHQTRWSLCIRLIHDDPQHYMPIPFTVLLEFRHQTNLPHPSFDPSHLVEIRTTIHPNCLYLHHGTDTISFIRRDGELRGLDNLERLQFEIHLNDGNPFDNLQMELMNYLRSHAWRWESASDIVDRSEHRFKTLRDCGRGYEPEITVGGSPIDDVLREWKEKIAAIEREEGAKEDGGAEKREEGAEEEGGAEEREGCAEGAGEGTESEGGIRLVLDRL